MELLGFDDKLNKIVVNKIHFSIRFGVVHLNSTFHFQTKVKKDTFLIKEKGSVFSFSHKLQSISYIGLSFDY